MKIAAAAPNLALSAFDPPPLEVFVTRLLGNTLVRSFYRAYVNSLELTGSEKILDYGSGSGVCSRYLAAQLDKGGSLTCVDVSRVWLETAQKTLRRYSNVDYALGSITALDLPAASYDVVFIHFVIHDIPQQERAEKIQALARLLRPGGRLCQREPQGRGLAPEEMRAMLRAAGLQECSFLLVHSRLGGEMFQLEYQRPVFPGGDGAQPL